MKNIIIIALVCLFVLPLFAAESTAGFYKYSDGELFYAPISIIGPGWAYYVINHGEYTYPIRGEWWYFATAEEARAFFKIPDPPPMP